MALLTQAPVSAPLLAEETYLTRRCKHMSAHNDSHAPQEQIDAEAGVTLSQDASRPYDDQSRDHEQDLPNISRLQGAPAFILDEIWTWPRMRAHRFQRSHRNKVAALLRAQRANKDGHQESRPVQEQPPALTRDEAFQGLSHQPARTRCTRKGEELTRHPIRAAKIGSIQPSSGDVFQYAFTART